MDSHRTTCGSQVSTCEVQFMNQSSSLTVKFECDFPDHCLSWEYGLRFHKELRHFVGSRALCSAIKTISKIYAELDNVANVSSSTRYIFPFVSFLLLQIPYLCAILLTLSLDTLK